MKVKLEFKIDNVLWDRYLSDPDKYLSCVLESMGWDILAWLHAQAPQGEGLLKSQCRKKRR
jgi:hypothetical protein